MPALVAIVEKCLRTENLNVTEFWKINHLDAFDT